MSEKHRIVLILPLDVESQEEQWEIVKRVSELNLPLVIGRSHIAIEEKAEEIEALIKSWDWIEDTTYYNEATLFKVNAALRDSGLSPAQAKGAINEMQNANILFRERI